MKSSSIEVEITKRAMKDADFRKALKKDPKGVIEKEFKVSLPKTLQIQVHEDADNITHLVLPKAQGELSDGELEAVAGGRCCTCGVHTHQTLIEC
jgi:hypothetical protein